jgi:hypothetical protein
MLTILATTYGENPFSMLHVTADSAYSMEMRKGWAEHQPREHPTSTEIGNET